jgi:sterol 24-C-methyltransferase
MTSTQYSDGRQQTRVENYTKFWQNDFGKEREADNQNRVESYTDVVNGIFPHSFIISSRSQST